MDYFFLIESPNQFAFFSDSYLDSIDKEACEKAFTKTQASIYQLNDDTSFEEASKKVKGFKCHSRRINLSIKSNKSFLRRE